MNKIVKIDIGKVGRDDLPQPAYIGDKNARLTIDTLIAAIADNAVAKNSKVINKLVRQDRLTLRNAIDSKMWPHHANLSLGYITEANSLLFKSNYRINHARVKRLIAKLQLLANVSYTNDVPLENDLQPCIIKGKVYANGKPFAHCINDNEENFRKGK